MQVREELNKELKRVYTITVSQEDVEAAQGKRFEEIAKTAKIQGFRPGKAPLTIIRQRFGSEVESEVLDRLVNEGSQNALKDNNLRPAVRPKVDLVSAGEGDGVSFKLEVEVLPEITAMDFSKLSFEKHVAEVDDKTIGEAIERIAKSMKKPEAISEKRAAVKGDVVIIDFDGSVDGKPQEGMKADNHEVELGSHSLIDTFEEQMEGMSVGDKKDITVTFPENYHAAQLTGKEAVFAVELKEIRAHGEFKMDDALAKEIGFPSLEKLRERVRDDILGNYNQISRTVLKRDLMDVLAEKHDFKLPESMIEQEFDAIWQQVQKDKAEGRLGEAEAKKSEDVLKADYRTIAARRVRLGLLLAHVAEENKTEVTQEELRAAMMAEARRYPGQEQAVLEYFTKTKEAVTRLRAPILEEKVVDLILSKAEVAEKKINADDLLKLPEEMG